MNIVLITDKPRANPVEYFCVANGGRIIGIVNHTNEKYENQYINCYTIKDLPRIRYDLVIVDCVDMTQVYRELKEYQLENIYNYWADRNKLLEILNYSRMLCKRKFVVSDDCLQVGTCFNVCERKVTEDVPSVNSNVQQNKITSDVFEAYKHADLEYLSVDERYRTGENWRKFMEEARPNFYGAIQQSDTEVLSGLLNNFFRNELTGGTFGGKEGFDIFCDSEVEYQTLRDYFNVWKHCVPDTPIRVLDNPKVGNPYGVLIDDSIINANNFCNHYRSTHLNGLICDINRPIVAELGGGFGGLAYYLSKGSANFTYINFDLPENLMVSSYYLKSIFSDKKIKTYDGSNLKLDREELEKYDLVLLPHFCLPLLQDLSVDLFVNTISLAEMDFINIKTYSIEIVRVTKKYFYHENMLDNGSAYKYYPTSVFPALAHFKLLMNAPSRWPAFSLLSPSHCHMEYLYERQ